MRFPHKVNKHVFLKRAGLGFLSFPDVQGHLEERGGIGAGGCRIQRSSRTPYGQRRIPAMDRA